MGNPKKQTAKIVSKSKLPEDIKIPISVISDRSLATLEAVAEYMKDSLGLTYHKIAVLLNRNDRTIWTCCHRAKIKRMKNG